MKIHNSLLWMWVYIETIIIRMPNWVGDLVMATPLLSDLRSYFPNASITAMCVAPLAELLQEDRSIDELFTFHREDRRFLRRDEQRDVLATLQAGNYDLGILVPRSFSSAFWFWRGHVRRRIGFVGRWRNWLLTDRVAWPSTHQHLSLTYKELLRPLGIAPSATPPRLYLTKDEWQVAEELLLQRGYRRGAPLIGIHPGAAYGPAKSWPEERFRELVQRLDREGKAYVVLLGDAMMRERARALSAGCSERVINLTGATSLRELVALMQHMTLLVANDSGPMHLAAAVGTPLVALFGSTDPVVTGPYGQEGAVLQKRVACAPCFLRVCPIDFRCMKEITVHEVVERIRPHLGKSL